MTKKKAPPLGRPKMSGLPAIDPVKEARFLAQPETVDGKPSTSTVNPVVSAPGAGPGWEAKHKRVTFHCPIDLLEAIEQEVQTSGRSKSRLVTDAIREHLTAK